MKNTLIIFTVLVALCVVLIACSTAKSSGSNNSSAEEMFISQEYTIELDGNPTTGYQWICSIVSGEDVIACEDSNYNHDSNPEFMVGVGGTYTFTFKSLKAGTAEVQFDYARQWEDSPINTKTVRFSVNERGSISEV